MRIRRIAAVGGLVSTLAAVGIVLQTHKRAKEITWTLFADLKNLAKAQAAYYTDHTAYARDLADLYFSVHGSVIQITSASDTSWSAVATHPRSRRVATIALAQPQRATNRQISAASYAAITALRAELGMATESTAR